MTVGGIRITESQFRVLSWLQKQGKAANTTVNFRTASSLMGMGLVEVFVPEATNYAMASRGRVRYYRLTAAGEEAINGLRKLYPDMSDKEPPK